MIFTIFEKLFVCFLFLSFIFASIQIIIDFNSPFGNFPFRPLVGGLVLEKAYKKLPVILKYII
jgi:hypothetical protein